MSATESRTRPDVAPLSPPAQRHRRAVWRDPRLVTGVVIVAGCGLLGGVLLGRTDRTVTVWAAAHPLAAGQPLGDADLVRREVGLDAASGRNPYLPADRPPPDGSVLTRPVGPGELVPSAALAAPRSDPVTEVPLSVVPDALPAGLENGATVDVWVVPDRTALPAGTRPVDAELVFDDVTVLSIGRPGTSLAPAGTRQVSVGVGSSQRLGLPHALTALAGGAVVLTRQR